LNRNDFIFHNNIVSSPRALIFRLISFLQHWMMASTGADRASLEQMVEEVRSQVSEELVATGVGGEQVTLEGPDFR
jgi:hypothetical protein